MRETIAAAFSPCGSRKANPPRCAAIWAQMFRNRTDLPVPVWPKMTVCRARATGSTVTGTFEERPRVVVPMMMGSGVMDGGEPCVVQGREFPLGQLAPTSPSSLAASSGNTMLATPACGRRPLTGVIPGHKQCGPIALYNAKDSKIQKTKSGKREKGKSGKVQSRKSSANNFVV